MTKLSKSSWIATTLLLVFLTPSICTGWSGKVINVSDGDTLTVLHDSKQEKIRLYGVDAPEKKQNFGQKSRDFASSFVAGESVDIERVDTDRYGRTVGVVSINGENLNEMMIVNGYAWVYRQYCKEKFCSNWVKMEEAARQMRKGMWDDPQIVPPWEWRHAGTKQKTIQSNSGQSANLTPAPSAFASARYHGNVNSYKFHTPECKDYNCKNCSTVFKSREGAIAAGYTPCKLCNP